MSVDWWAERGGITRGSGYSRLFLVLGVEGDFSAGSAVVVMLPTLPKEFMRGKSILPDAAIERVDIVSLHCRGGNSSQALRGYSLRARRFLPIVGC
jgi:hypothetical protein